MDSVFYCAVVVVVVCLFMAVRVVNYVFFQKILHKNPNIESKHKISTQ